MPFPVVARRRNRRGQFLRAGRGQNLGFAVEISTLSVVVRGITISGFGGHIAISVCRSML